MTHIPPHLGNRHAYITFQKRKAGGGARSQAFPRRVVGVLSPVMNKEKGGGMSMMTHKQRTRGQAKVR